MEDGKGRVTLTTDPPDMMPVMTFAASAALRERMFLAYNTRAYPDNRQLLLDLLATRQEIASVLGFRSWADLATADQMMKSAANVRTFLAKLDEASREGARLEHAEVLVFARKRQPELAEIDIVSRGYWYEQFRRTKYDFDSQSVRPYFPYPRVEAGVLETAAKLFKVEFRPSPVPAWHPAVSVYEVFEDERLVGRFYLDMHPREGKSKWFSAAPVVVGVRGRVLPEAALICNFPARDESDPGLLQYSDVVTFFHEFGHLMHAILGGHTEWAGLSGFATEGDFIEVPSQMLEEFFRDEKLLPGLRETLRDRRGASLGAYPKPETSERVRPRRWGEDAALLHHALARSARSRCGGHRSRRHHTRVVQELSALDVARRQQDVRELRPSDGLLVELLHLHVRQGDRSRFLRAVRAWEICWARMPASATARQCSNRAARSRAKSWCATFWAATRSLPRSRSG